MKGLTPAASTIYLYFYQWFTLGYWGGLLIRPLQRPAHQPEINPSMKCRFARRASSTDFLMPGTRSGTHFTFRWDSLRAAASAVLSIVMNLRLPTTNREPVWFCALGPVTNNNRNVLEAVVTTPSGCRRRALFSIVHAGDSVQFGLMLRLFRITSSSDPEWKLVTVLP